VPSLPPAITLKTVGMGLAAVCVVWFAIRLLTKRGPRRLPSILFLCLFTAALSLGVAYEVRSFMARASRRGAHRTASLR
jgi:hypothetical protein